jgi:predicted XRE-type DNA-binding protein
MSTLTGPDRKLVRGTGNVYADLGMKDAEARQLRAILTGEIVKALDAGKPTVRAAEAMTGVAAADFSRLWQAKLKGFTIDRLMAILERLDCDVQVQVLVLPRAA